MTPAQILWAWRIGSAAAALAVTFGGYQVWKAQVKRGVVAAITIEEQSQAIETQQENAQEAAEDVEAKAVHEVESAARELARANDFLIEQSRRMESLEKENERLKAYVDRQPCLREPWPDSLQRGGGFDLNQRDSNAGSNPDADRRSDSD